MKYSLESPDGNRLERGGLNGNGFEVEVGIGLCWDSIVVGARFGLLLSCVWVGLGSVVVVVEIGLG